MSYGLGIIQNVELFGRFAYYTNIPPGIFAYGGPRDLSANIKVQIPYLPEKGPQLAIGMNDLAGGSTHFRSIYVVATQRWRALSGSLGYALGTNEEYGKTFDGTFGGLALRLGPTGLFLLAEYDGQMSHAGSRWLSPPIKKLGDLQMTATLQRAFSFTPIIGKDRDATFFALGLQWPVGNLDIHREHFQPAVTARLAEPPARTSEQTMEEPSKPLRVEQLSPFRQTLEAVGLERVRVGLRGDTSHPELVVEYENHRYGQNEVDALGLVLGLGSEMAPVNVQRIRVITLKDGLGLYETAVDVLAYRAFLRQGSVDPVRDSLTWHSKRSGTVDATHWEREASSPEASSPPTRMRFEIGPDLNYTLGTELGAFDYSLAAKARLIAPLWAGARFTSSYIAPIDHSLNMNRYEAFANMRQSRGMETISLGQSFWIGNRILLNVAAGQFHFHSLGTQSELEAFVPGTSDVLRLRGAAYHREPGGLDGGTMAGAVSYRHSWNPSNWLEVGLQRYSDGTSGPLVEWTYWSSDMGVTIFGCQGGKVRFAGLQLNFPLTARQGMKPYLASLAGPSTHSESIRTMITNDEQSANLVAPSWVKKLTLETSLEGDLLNSGRMGQPYLRSQLYRMREAFYLYGAKKLAQKTQK